MAASFEAVAQDTDACLGLLAQAIDSGDSTALRSFVTFMVSNDRTPVARINLVTGFVNAVPGMGSLADYETVATAAYGVMNGQDAFVEQLGKLCSDIADRLQEAERWKDTATWLGRTPTERMAPDARFILNARIAQVYLQMSDAMSARAYVNRALKDHNACKDVTYLTLFDVNRARVLDLTGEFFRAFKMYYDLSCRELLPDEKVHCLELAVVCAVLAKAGPVRSRALATIYKDERAKTLASYSILEKMYLLRILRPDEVEAFKSQLLPHHLALGEDGATILDRAVREHNIQAVADLYSNISFEELGAILGIDAAAAEELVADLIGRGSLTGSIDQAAGFVSFNNASPLQDTDSRIRAICTDVAAIVGPIAAAHPELADA